MDNGEFDLILGNSNSKFSGVSSTMLQTMRLQRQWINLRILGEFHLDNPEIAISFWHLVNTLRKRTKENKFRVFHARRNDEMIQALILKHIFRAKIKICFTSTAQRQHSKFTRFLIRQMDGVISTCPEAAQYLAKPPNIIISHGVNTDLWRPLANRRDVLEEFKLEGRYAIGIFGRVRKQKGIDLFVNACIQALPANPKFCAVIVGGISAKDQKFVTDLKTRIHLAGLENRILFLGEQDFDKIPRLMGAMHLVCALSHNEGFGLTVLEAMACGCAVLATEAGAWKTIIDEGETGNIVATGDQTAITKTLSSLLQSTEKLEAMGQAGRKKVEQEYRLETEAEQLCNYYRTLQNKTA